MQKYEGWYAPDDDISIKRAWEQTHGRGFLRYQYREHAHALQFVNNTRRAIDCGSHIGIVSVRLSRTFDHVECFEIDPRTRECSLENIKLHSEKPHTVTVHPTGLGSTSESLGLHRTNKSFSTHVQGQGEYPVVALDQYGWRDVDFVKIDCEGYELAVIQGASDTLAFSRPVVLFEEKGHAARYGVDASDILTHLRFLGYRQFMRTGFKNDNIIAIYS